MAKKAADKKWLVTYSGTGHVDLVRTKAAAMKAASRYVKGASKYSSACISKQSLMPPDPNIPWSFDVPRFGWTQIKCVRGRVGDTSSAGHRRPSRR